MNNALQANCAALKRQSGAAREAQDVVTRCCASGQRALTDGGADTSQDVGVVLARRWRQDLPNSTTAPLPPDTSSAMVLKQSGHMTKDSWHWVQ